MDQVRIISEARCCLETDDKKLRARIDKALSYEKPGSDFSGGHQQWLRSSGKDGWDGMIHLLTPGARTFPRGLLTRVLQVATDAGKPLTVVDERKGLFQPLRQLDGSRWPPKAPERQGRPFPAISMPIPRDFIGIGPKNEPLRQDQVDAIEAVWKAQRGIIGSATGAGKTEMAIALTKWLLKHDWPGIVLFITNRKKLLRETAERFIQALRDSSVGTIDGRGWDIPLGCRVIVASIDTLAVRKPKEIRRHKSSCHCALCDRVRAAKKRRKNLFSWATCAFVDEVHHVAATTWRRTVAALPARVLIGLSGTAMDRDDGKNLVTEGAIGPMAYSIDAHTLQKQGALATCSITVIPCRIPDLSEERDYVEARRQGIIENAWRNWTIAKRCKRLSKQGYRSIIIVTELNHGYSVQKAFRAIGMRVEFIHGNTPDDEQQQACDALTAGNADALIASSIFREGVNMPAVDHIVLADGGKSVIAAVQKIGRGLRRKEGRNHLVVTDFADLTHKQLAAHSLKRLETFRAKRYPVKFREAKP